MPDRPAFDAVGFDQDGFASIAPLIDGDLCRSLAAEFEALQGAGSRHLIAHPAVCSLVECTPLAELVREILGAGAFAYKATLFDKHTEANWLVAWHQDLSIPVQQQIELDGWTGWSRKEGVLYVQPPTDVLSRLVAVRINLDDCSKDNGPLRILSGSHRLGRLKHDDIPAHVASHSEETATGTRGSGVVMRPLLIHASSKATVDARRRVLHLEFANFALPAGLDWHRRVGVES